MAYILHYDDGNPNQIREYIVLLDDKPSTFDIEDFCCPGFSLSSVHHISDNDWPSALPLDRELCPKQL